MPGLTAPKEIIAIRNGEWITTADEAVVETPLTIYLNGEELVTLLCTPDQRESLALGFLRTGGMISSLADVAAYRLQEDGKAVEVELTPGARDRSGEPAGERCGRGLIHPKGNPGGVSPGAAEDLPRSPAGGGKPRLAEGEIHDLMGELQKRAVLFKATGGAHSAALAVCGKIVIFCEDIGRHNAVDKVAGESLRQGISMDDKALLLSCRLSLEILHKAARLQAPLLISRSAPTAQSIDLAHLLQITLVGFVREGRMNIYTHPYRIKR